MARGLQAMFTDKQIASLKYLIFRSKIASVTAKQLVALLIDPSEKLTREVHITLNQDQNGYTEEEVRQIGRSVDTFNSCNCDTHLTQILHAMGAELGFSLHYGHYRGNSFDTSGQFDGSASMSYTFWLAKEMYGRGYEGKEIFVAREDIEAIDISKPGLYPELENQPKFQVV